MEMNLKMKNPFDVLFWDSLSLKTRWFLFINLELPCLIWDLRGLKRCRKHGFHAQSLIDGYCYECKGKRLVNI